MDSYRRRTPAQVIALTDDLRSQLAARVHSAASLGSLLERLKFRDQQGGTWTRGPLTGAWYLYQQGRWVMSPTPPQGPLDGPADLGILEKIRADAAEVPAAKSKPRGKAAEPAAYFQQAVGRVAAAYDTGTITSDAAEAQLQDLYVVDSNATAWMLGLQSRAWYTYDGNRWQRAEKPLDLSALSSSPEGGAVDLGSSAAQKIRQFLSRAARIPEPVVPEWSPPAGYPEPVVTCPHCSAHNVGDVEACVSCQRPLKSEAPASAKPRAALPVASPATAASVAAPAQPAVPHPPEPRPTLAAVGSTAAPAATPKRSRGRRWLYIGAGSCLLAVCACAALVLALNLMGGFTGLTLFPENAPPAEQPADLPPIEAPEQIVPASSFALEDTFDDPVRTATPLFPPGIMEFEVDSGIGLMTSHYNGVLAAMYDSPVVGDFTATLEMQPLDPAPGAGYGLIFRSDDAIDGLAQYYVALVAPADGVVTLTRWDSAGASELIRSPYASVIGDVIQLTVRADGSRIDIEIDGNSAATVIDESTLGPGIFGLAMNSPKQGDLLAFLSLQVESQDR